MSGEAAKGDKWELYYHHFLNGRSAYIRLIFEELGIPYEDMVKSKEDIMKFFYSDEKLANAGFPVLHPPVVKNGKSKIFNKYDYFYFWLLLATIFGDVRENCKALHQRSGDRTDTKMKP